MGARGKVPMTAEELKARGSWKAKERQGTLEPALPVKEPSCPGWLPTEGKLEWGRQVKQLLALRVLAEIDRAALAVYCEAWAEFVAVTQAILARCRPVAKGGLGPLGYAACVAEGLDKLKTKAADRMLRLAAQFGFTPSARARLRAVPVAPGTPEDDAFEALLSGKSSDN